MAFTQQQVWDEVRQQAITRGFDPYLVMAICEQECEHRVNGKFDRKLFRSDKIRLEQAFYERYVERQNQFATTSEGLLAASWGVMQVMGLSLKEMYYFEWYFQQSGTGLQKVIASPFSQFAIPSALDFFAESLSTQIKFGIQWLEVKRKLAGGNIQDMLLKWNGGGNQLYDDQVLARIPQLKKELK